MIIVKLLERPIAPTSDLPEQAPIAQSSSAFGRASWLTWWPVRDVLIPFIATRLMLTVIGCLALAMFRDLPVNPVAWEIKGDGNIGAVTTHLSSRYYPPVNIWSRWDAAFFHSIAKGGYNYIPGERSNAAFFPGYPMAMRAVHAIVPRQTDLTWFVSGLLVSNAALIIGLCYLVRLVRLDTDHATAARAAFYALLFPTTFYFSAVYSESLFLAAVIASFYYARKNRWLMACALAGLATLTRAPGVFLALPLLLEYMRQRGYRLREIRPDLAAFALIPASLGGLLLYFHWSVGNMFAISDTQAAWGNGWGHLSAPWRPYVRFFSRGFSPVETIDFIFAVSALVFAVIALNRLRLSYGVYAVVGYWFITAWGALDSAPRYVLPIFPIFIVLALWGRNPIFDRFYVIGSTGLAALFMLRFALWQWGA